MAMDKSRAEIEIVATLKKVFYFISNLKNLPQWAGINEIEVVEETPNSVGSKYMAVTKTLLSKTKVPLEVTALNPPTKFSFIDQEAKSEFVYTFMQLETGTKIVLENVVHGFSFALSDRKLAKLLANLKKYLESED